MSEGVRPGHERKFPFFIALMKVLGAGLKQQAWRYVASSVFVLFLCIIILIFWLILLMIEFIGVLRRIGSVALSQ